MSVSIERNKLLVFLSGLAIAAVALLGYGAADAAAKPKLEITKKSASVVQNGAQLVFTIKVENTGTNVSKGTKVTDLVPAAFVIDSVDSPCTVSGQLVVCVIGNLPAGESRTYKIRTTASLSNFDTPNDQLNVSKVEKQISMPAGTTHKGTITCDTPGALMLDGSFRVDSVDQGTGDFSSVDVTRLQSSSESSYEYTLKNNASGQAQAKVFGVCVDQQTTGGHTLSFNQKVTDDWDSLAPGFHVITPKGCLDGTPVSPGFNITKGSASLIGSEPFADRRRFTFKVTSEADITASFRCLDNARLDFKSIKKTIKVKPNRVVTKRLSCPVGYKGIVAGWKYNRKLVPLGNDPQPINRDFKIWNPTKQVRKATLHLLCVSIRTVNTGATLTNIGVVSSTSQQEPGAILFASKIVTIKP